MIIPFYKRLWFEILVRIGIVIGIITIASFFYISYHQKKSILNHEREFIVKLSETIEKSMYYSMEKNDFSIIKQMLNDITRDNEHVKSIKLIDKNGKVIISSDFRDNGKVLVSNEGLCDYCHTGSVPKRDKFAIVETGDKYKVVNLLYNGPTCSSHHSPTKKVLGAMVIDVSSTSVNNLIKSSMKRMFLSSGIGLIAMIFLTFLAITLLVTCPIKDLMKAMLDASKGNMNVEVKIPSGNEIGILAKTFNYMLGRLRELHDSDVAKEREIAKMQESLRYKAELETLNAQLKSRVIELESANRQIELMVKDIENKNYHLEKAVDRLRILYKISTSLTTVVDSDEVIKLIVEKSANIMKAKIASLMLVDREKNELYIKYAIGLRPELLNIRVSMDNSISGWVAREGKPLIVKDIEVDERFKRVNRATYESKSLISSPVIIKGEVVGVLNVNNKFDGGVFTEDELELLNTLAGQTAISLENAKLYADLQKSYFDTIRALVNAIEAKDKYTRGHSERVTCYSLEIGKRLNLSAKQMEALQHAAILHDIGKIGTDLGILHKNGMLTNDEFEVIKEHPVVGSQIIEPISFLNNVKRIVTEHHERYDGKGYPHGKKGEELSLEARIIAITDAYDAMTSDRPYRKAFTLDEAMGELRKKSGTQFDPKIVEVFEKVIAKYGIIK
jgi:putative nucleotidyltransferase with HDIG domain